VREYYNNWMNRDDLVYTAMGRIKKPSYATLAEWVSCAWSDVDSGLIARSFKCCGISVARDGSKDDQIFDYDRLLNIDDDNITDGKENIFSNDNFDINEELNYEEQLGYDIDWE
ncbi:6626_t:CDS:1, partial [Acaulospora morrowiae]